MSCIAEGEKGLLHKKLPTLATQKGQKSSLVVWCVSFRLWRSLAHRAADLQQVIGHNFANACSSIGQSQESVKGFAYNMALGTSGWGFISGAASQDWIYGDSPLNGYYGWTMLQALGSPR